MKKILIVEDDKEINRLMRDYLSDNGCKWSIVNKVDNKKWRTK